MTKPRDPDALLSAYLAVGMEVLPDRVVDSVLLEVHRTRQRAVFGSWRTRPVSRTTLAAAAVVALVALGGAVFIAGRPPAVVVPNPTSEASSTPSQPAEVVPSETPAPTPTSTAEATPPAVGQNLKLTWTKLSLAQRSPRIAWLVDRFVQVDDESRVVQTSTDGFSWHVLQPGDPDPGYLDLMREVRNAGLVTWGDDIVRWWNPEEGADIAGKPPATARDIVRIVRPGAAPTDTTPFKGRIGSLGIGPAGIVATVDSQLDFDAWVTKKLGLRTNNDWTCCVKDVTFQNGVLQIKLNNGPGLKVNWADEGFLPGDYLYKGFGWYSPDGVQWTPIPGYGTDFTLNQVIGVSDGFIAQGEADEDRCPLPDGCGEMWHSSDGLTWRNLGPSAERPPEGRMVPWMGGALVTDGFGTFDFWTSQGKSELPMAAELPTAPKEPNATFATGPLGLVTLSMETNEVLFTRDGVDWDLGPMPAAMAADQTLDFGPSRPGDGPIVAVGDRSVLVVLWSGSREAKTPSLWRGTFEP
jgi:hypothetical protein